MKYIRMKDKIFEFTEDVYVVKKEYLGESAKLQAGTYVAIGTSLSILDRKEHPKVFPLDGSSFRRFDISQEKLGKYFKKVSYGFDLSELMDEFVFEKNVLLDPYESIIQNWKNNYGFILLDNIQKVYGAIWVEGERGEPILKPVTKMNARGELELL